MIKLPTVKTLDALDLLDALVRCDRLGDTEKHAFQDMAAKLRRGDKQQLSSPQREWAERRYMQLDLDAEVAVNAVSSGLVPGNPPGAPPVLKRVLEQVPKQFQKPLRPPGAS